MPSSASPTDAELEALRSRDPEAVRRWIYGNREYIHSVLQRYSSSSERARDLVQETFFQALRSLPDFRGNSKITTWLHSIAKNVALARHRKDQRHSYLEEETLEHVRATSSSEDAAAFFSAGPLAKSPVEDAEREQEYSLLHEAMEELSDSYREIIRLRDLEERSTKEVAERLNLTRVNVRVRLHRARTALREALEERVDADYPSFYRMAA
ncbi:MAG: RNA polymerase sigma factor [Salinibacter sp.]